MQTTPSLTKGRQLTPSRASRAPRMIAAKRVADERGPRKWSLLLPPKGLQAK